MEAIVINGIDALNGDLIDIVEANRERLEYIIQEHGFEYSIDELIRDEKTNSLVELLSYIIDDLDASQQCIIKDETLTNSRIVSPAINYDVKNKKVHYSGTGVLVTGVQPLDAYLPPVTKTVMTREARSLAFFGNLPDLCEEA